MRCTLDMCWFWLHTVWSNRLETTGETRASVCLMANLRSAAEEPVREANETFHFFLSTLKFFFCSFVLTFFFRSASKISPVLLTLPERSLLLQPSFLPLTLFASLWISPSHLLCLSTLPSLPFSPLSSSFPPSSLTLVLWKQALSGGLNSAGPLEARTMGPSSEGSRAHERGTKTLSPRGAPLWGSQHQSPLALHTVCVCVHVLGEKNVCVLACMRRQVLPLGIPALWICPPKLAWLSAIILKQAAFSCWHCASIIVQIYRSAWPPVHSHHFASSTYVY